MSIGGDFDYDAHGGGYAAHRRPDPRIAAFIHTALGAARTVLNVGAGTGSYEPEDRYVLAVEPSATMRAQRPRGAGLAIEGVAARLPVDDGAVDAAMAIMTVHQWPDLGAGLKELRRATRGPVVVVAGDGATLDRWWLNAYAPELLAAERRRYPPIEAIVAGLGGAAEIVSIPIPHDCTDGLTEAFYGRPETLLEPGVRRAQSSWAFVGEGVEARFVERLGADLASGRWDALYGEWRARPVFHGSLRMIVAPGGGG